MLAISLTLAWFKLPFWELIGGLAIFIFCLSVNLPNGKILYKTLRAESMWIYFTHAAILFGLDRFLLPAETNFPLYGLLLISILLSVTISTAIYLLSLKYPKINFLIS